MAKYIEKIEQPLLPINTVTAPAIPQLPHVIILKISQYLKGKDLANILSTCKDLLQFRAQRFAEDGYIMGRIYGKQYLTKITPSEQPLEDTHSLTRYKKRKISPDSTPYSPITLLQEIRNKNTFTKELDVIDMCITDNQLDAMTKELPHLEKLSMRHLKCITYKGFASLQNLTNLYSLDISDCTYMTDAECIVLQNLKGLQFLNMSHCTIRDKGLEYLANHLTKLQVLNLSYCSNLTDKGFASLHNLKELLTLDITGRTVYGSPGCSITDQRLAHLAVHLTKLQFLNLSYCMKLTDTGFASLQNLEDLRSLDLTGCAITDEGLAYLATHLTKLQVLNLSDCKKLTDKGFALLQNLKELQSLDLTGCAISNKGLEALQNIKIQFLNLTQCTKITGSGLAPLATLPQLQELKLCYFGLVNDETCAALGTLKELRLLDLSSAVTTVVTKEGITHLKGLTHLQRINVWGCEEKTRSLIHTHLKNIEIGY